MIRGAWRLQQIWKHINRRGVALMYHRVADLERDPWQISVTPKHFEEHMQVLKKFAGTVKVRQMGQKLGYFSPGKVKDIAVTFDDGYADNAHNARPILERHGIAATFFIVSGAINEQEEFWWDQLERIILGAKALPEALELHIAGTPYTWPTEDRDKLYRELWELLSHFSFPDKKILLQQIADGARQTLKARSTHLPMTSPELVSLSKCRLFEIGAHTVTHPMLSRLTPKEQEEEMGRSKKHLEEIIGRPVTSFSYPHGEYTDETVRIIQRLNFKAACSVVQRGAVRRDSPYLLPRFMVLNWNGDEFERNLSKWISAGAL